MAHIERMPKSGYTMRQGTVTAVLVRPGDVVEKGAPLLEYETDKITGEVAAGAGGTVLRVLVEEWDAVPVLAPLLVIGRAGEDIDSLLKAEGGPPLEASAEVEVPADAMPQTAPAIALPQPEPAPDVETKVPGRSQGAVLASPYAKRLAAERGLALDGLCGSGPAGTLRARDILAASEQTPMPLATPLARKRAGQAGKALAGIVGSGARGKILAQDVAAAGGGNWVPARLSSMRQTIGDRLAHSKQTIPHAYYDVDVDATELVALRARLGEAEKPGDAHVTLNDLVLLATARALATHAAFRGRLVQGRYETCDAVHLGLAVSVQDGLMVPVLRDADRLCLAALSGEAAALAACARRGVLTPEETADGCFTVSNLGAWGLRRFAAVINPPQSGILAVGALEQRAVVRDGAVVPRQMLTLTLSADHRLVDGAAAAAFLTDLKEALQRPYGLLL